MNRAIHRLSTTLPIFFVGVFVTFLGVLHAADPDLHSLLKTTDLTPRPQKSDVRVDPNRKQVRSDEKNAIIFSLKGDAEARGVWAAPIDLSMQTSYLVDFSITSKNVLALGRRPNVFIRLTPLQKGRPGREIPVFTAAGDGDELGQVRLDLREQVPSRADLVVDLTAKAAGEAEITLNSLSVSYVGNLLPVDAKDLYGSSRLEVGIDDGKITWMGKPLPVRCASSKANEAPDPQLLEAAGFTLKRVTVGPGLWKRRGFFDRHQLKARILETQLPVMLEVQLTDAPSWWLKSQKKKTAFVSDFNPAWVRFCENYLEQLFAGLETLKLDEKVPLVILTTGRHQDAVGPIDRERDPNVQNAFREWLKNKYGSIEKIRSARRTPDLQLDTIQWIPPSRWPRAALGPIMVGSPTAELKDSINFLHSSRTQFTIHLSQFVKRLTKKRVLCGAVWHPLELAPLWDNRFFPTTDPALEMAEAKSIDFLEIPFQRPTLSRVTTLPGSKLVCAYYAVESLDDMRLAWCGAGPEIEGSTFRLKKEAIKDQAQAKQVKDLWTAATVAKLKRRTGVAKAAFVYDPAMFQHIGPQRGLPVVTNHQRAQSPVPGYASKLPNAMHVLYTLARTLWPMAGIQYDVVTIDSLTEKSDYKLLVFAPVLELTDKRRELLEDLRKGGRVLVWTWASGLLQNGKLKPGAIGDLCAMTVRLSAKPGTVTMQATTQLKSFLETETLFNMLGAVNSPFDAKAGLAARFSPLFEIVDPKATALAVNSLSKKPALAYRKFFRWYSVYSVSPIINPEIVRACALKSKIHVYYSYNEPSLITDDIVLVRPSSDGKRVIRLPKEAPLYEVFSGMELPAAKQFEFNVKHGRTYLFYRGGKHAWQAGRDDSL